MNFVDELNSLDPSNPGGWPAWVKLSSVLLLMVAIGVAGYWFLIKDQKESLAKLEVEENTKKTEYRIKQQKASQLSLIHI